MATARPTTEEAAASLALSLLREPAIADMAEDSAAGRAVRKWFGLAREAALRSDDWNFASAWCQPAKSTTAALGPLTKRYPLPADTLRVREVDGLTTDEWVIEAIGVNPGDPAAAEAMVLVTEADAPKVRYTRNVTEVRLWDTLFLLAFARRLAEYLAGEFGKSAPDIQTLHVYAESDREEATGDDAKERAPRQLSRDTSWVRSRTRNG